jgi:hypothetical protein
MSWYQNIITTRQHGMGAFANVTPYDIAPTAASLAWDIAWQITCCQRSQLVLKRTVGSKAYKLL